MKVTLIDNEKNPGGVCLYRGCIPSKALLHVAKVLDESKHATDWGIEFGDAKVDIDKLRDYKNRVVEKLTERHRPGVEVPQGQLHPGLGDRSSTRRRSR